jgi:hypothetical protein
MASRLYVDMDGVLVDFVKGAESYFKVAIERLGGIKASQFTALWESPQGWRQLKKDWPTFWMDLDPEPSYAQLLKLVRPRHPAVLTAIPKGWPSSATGKRIWCSRHMPGWGHHPHEKFHAVDRSQKRQYAKQADGTPNLLIDDYDKNIAEWESAGGIGLLYAGGNSQRFIAQALTKHMSK